MAGRQAFPVSAPPAYQTVVSSPRGPDVNASVPFLEHWPAAWNDQLVATRAERWNHNIHYHPLLLDEVPDGAQVALDVGCGEGMLARELRQVVPKVVAIDLDRASIELAKAEDVGDHVEYVRGDFLTYPFAAASFDVIVSVATIHHMDAAVALGRMRDLLKPGGRLGIIGLARSTYPVDLPFELAAAVAHRFHGRTNTHWEHPSPKVWPPPETYAGMQRLAAGFLPGCRYRRHLLWRYSLTWTKPVG